MAEQRGPDGLTNAERHAQWDSEAAAYECRCSERKAADYHTRCRDCGVFVKKSRWVKKDSFNALKHQQRPLCGGCFDEYD